MAAYFLTHYWDPLLYELSADIVDLGCSLWYWIRNEIVLIIMILYRRGLKLNIEQIVFLPYTRILSNEYGWTFSFWPKAASTVTMSVWKTFSPPLRVVRPLSLQWSNWHIQTKLLEKHSKKNIEEDSVSRLLRLFGSDYPGLSAEAWHSPSMRDAFS